MRILFWSRTLVFAGIVLPTFCPAGARNERAATDPAPGNRSDLAKVYGDLPIQFEENRRQADKRVKFVAHEATPTPELRPAPGSYAKGQKITITDADAIATIRYTTDGSTPTDKSDWYHVPIVLTGSETIKAIAISTGDAASVVASSSYTVP